MYNYELSQGNPEGIDYSISFQHEECFTSDQFQDMCEAAMVEVLNKMKQSGKYTSLCNIDTGILMSIMESKGFTLLVTEQTYHLEPYWGKDAIKNQELLEWTKQ